MTLKELNSFLLHIETLHDCIENCIQAACHIYLDLEVGSFFLLAPWRYPCISTS